MSSPQQRSKLGHNLAKVLGIKLDQNGTQPDPVSRGESVFSVTSADTYVEEEPRSIDWLLEFVPTGQEVLDYLISLFPFINWIGKYNVQWLIGDLVAGITVGAVVVPQGMAYAKLANLPVQFGLYTSFMGVLIYWFFATSKDITIGPVAVLSTVTGHVVTKVSARLPDGFPVWYIAQDLSIICGSIVLFIGLIRWGWIVELIPLAAIAAFLTGSSVNIAVGQVPNLMGITGFDARASTYKVVINILKHLGRTTIDAAMGLTALTMLYIIRTFCNQMAKRYPSRRKTFFFINTLRTAFVILLYTMISWLVNRHRRAHPLFKILGHVPRGFTDVGPPVINTDIISAFADQIPVVTIVMLIEHISISKSFGRVNGYKINPSQELVAIGTTNVLGPLLGAYPATGSFTRTAIKSKAGVRTPLAGVITAIVVLLAIYALPAVFFYIPNASLAGVIIHAVLDLITPPNTLYQFWRVNPIEVIIFLAGVFVTVFSSIENGIYTTICISFAILLFRILRAKGRFVGKVQVHSVIGDHLLEGNESQKGDGFYSGSGKPSGNDPDNGARNIFIPLDHQDGSNPEIRVVNPYPGIFIYRFSEGFNYPNASHYLDDIVDQVMAWCRRGNPNSYARLGDRPWNDPGPTRKQTIDVQDNRPTVKAIILDFSSVNNIDVTATQTLIDVRNQLDRYASPYHVEWHFANINNRWTKRALVSAGFGYPTPTMVGDENYARWKPIYSVAEIGGEQSAAADAEHRFRRQSRAAQDVESKGQDDRITSRAAGASSDEDSLKKELSGSKAYGNKVGVSSKIAVVQGVNRPLFHIDVTSALQSAIASVEAKGGAKADVAYVPVETQDTLRAGGSEEDRVAEPRAA